MQVAVAILNWNGKDFLEKFLPGVIEHSDSASIWVIDNASTDSSVAFLKEHFPTVNLVVNESNGGFAKGYNDGLKSIEADVYVLLNSDVEVTPNWIDPILALFRTNEKMAACQPKIKSYHSRTQFEHAGAAGGFLDRNGFPFCRGRLFNSIEQDTGQYDVTDEVFWATGACLFIRSETFHNAKGFDEDFFAHMEEIDLCWRLKNQGKEIGYSSKSEVYHVGGGTLNYMSPKKTFLNFRNNLFMLIKNYQGGLFLKMIWRMMIDGIAAFKFLFSGQFSHFWSVFKAHMHVYGKLRTMLRKRKALQVVNVPNKKGRYQKSIVRKFFFGSAKKFSDLDPADFE